MAINIGGFFEIQTITLGASDVATRVNPPSWTRFLHIQFLENDGKIAYDGTDNAPIGDAFVLTAGQGVELQARGDHPVYLASAVAGTQVTVCALDRP